MLYITQMYTTERMLYITQILYTTKRMLYITQNIIYNILCYIYHKKILYTTERMLCITKTDQQFFNIVALNHHRLQPWRQN